MSALFGPSEKHHVVEGGFCISAFAVARRGEEVLLVKPKEHQAWAEWAPNWKLYEPERYAAEFQKWRFPSSYVREGEHPDHSLSRIVQEQLGVKRYRAGRAELLNFYDPSRRYPGKMHWDYCFVYETNLGEEPGPRPWFSAVEYVDSTKLSPQDFGSGQGDLLGFFRARSG